MNDDTVFNLVYVEYRPVLHALAMRYGLPYKEAEDMIQETFLSYFTHYPIDWDSRKMKWILVRILKNKCVDFMKKKQPVLIDLDDWESAPKCKCEYINLLISKDSLSIVIEKEEHQEIWETINTMRADWLEVFVLYIIQDRPIKEVSEILGTSVEACRTRISRGRKYLKEKLGFRRMQQTQSDFQNKSKSFLLPSQLKDHPENDKYCRPKMPSKLPRKNMGSQDSAD